VQLTKYTHSCVRFDDGDRTLVIDPGVFSEVHAALDGASDVLITHEHPDHIQLDEVQNALRRDSRLRVWAPAPVAATLAEFGEQVVTTEPGQAFDAAGFAVRAFGGQHAVIHPTIPVIANVGYLIDDTVYHPGDSLIVPTAAVQVLLVPVHAPWSKVSEVIDFAVAVRAPRATGIHDALLTDAGRGLVQRLLTDIGGPHGVDYAPLQPAETLSV
jgi:L-ascorbate metabolism protein UlaG (beta-lactamase superfamily)